MSLFDQDWMVRDTPDLRRVLALPRRDWQARATETAEALGAILRTPHGTMKLRPAQAQALLEIDMYGGLFAPLRVGSGKTLISLLAAAVLDCKRPLLLIPAALKEKTKRDRKVLSYHWQIPRFVRVITYEWLGRQQGAEALPTLQPDLIVADEAHKLKNPKAAVTRRVKRYMQAHPETAFVAMSGTITKRSILDYAHILKWCLASPPLPLPLGETEMWADALDERKGQLRRTHPGALHRLCSAGECDLWRTDERGAARQAYRRRLTDTAGVLASQQTDIDAGLEIRALETPRNSTLSAAFNTLRDEYETPDGWPIADSLGMFRHSRELGLGFFYRWNPRPPDEWLEKRRVWAAFVRRTIRYSKRLDSEAQVRRVFAGTPECQDWLAVRDTFEPHTEAVWLTDEILKICAHWMASCGIVWVEHREFGNRLSELSGVPYYGRKGLDTKGRPIEDHPPAKPLIASVASNSTGRNLQAWHRNLIVSHPPNGLQTEQLLGRTHRDGQEADTVTVDVLLSCREHLGAFWQAVADARFVHDTTGAPQKLLDATIDVPTPEECVTLY